MDPELIVVFFVLGGVFLMASLFLSLVVLVRQSRLIERLAELETLVEDDLSEREPQELATPLVRAPTKEPPPRAAPAPSKPAESPLVALHPVITAREPAPAAPPGPVTAGEKPVKVPPAVIIAAPQPSIETRQPAPVPASEPIRRPPPVAPTKAKVGWTWGERNVGAYLTVWIGAIALVIGGGFLVKYGIDQGLITPTVRVTMAVVGGLALIIGAEFVRRGAATAAAGLAAAGIGLMYVGFLAASRLHELIPSSIGFAAVALTSALGILLALRHGVIVAYVGLLGGYLAPILVPSKYPAVDALVGYLLIFGTAVMTVAVLRRWNGLVLATLLAVLTWTVIAFKQVTYTPLTDWYWIDLYIVVSTVKFVFPAIVPRLKWYDPDLNTSYIAYGAIMMALTLLVLVMILSRFGFGHWFVLGGLAIAALMLERLDVRFPFLGWFAASAPAFALLSWKIAAEDHAAASEQPLVTLEVGRYTWIALVQGVGTTAIALAAGWRASQPGRWGALGMLSVFIYYLLARLALEPPPAIGWGGVCVIIAVVILPVAIAWLGTGDRKARRESGMTAALVSAIVAFVTLAIPLSLDREWIAVAWGVETAALAWISRQLGPIRQSVFGATIPLVRTVAPLVAALCVGQLMRTTFFELPSYVDETTLWLWVVYGYGIPVFSFALAAWLFHSKSDDAAVAIFEWAAIWLGLYAIIFLLLVFWQGDSVILVRLNAAETGSIATIAIIYAVALHQLERRVGRDSFTWSARAIAFGGMAAAIIGCGLFYNPVLRATHVGSVPIINLLLVVYGAPVVASTLFGILMARAKATDLELVSLGSALLLGFILLTLEVRHFFHPTAMHIGDISVIENYTYSAAWLVLGIALILPGIAFKRVELRIAGLIVLTLAVFKVFVYDANVLTGLYRVASFFGLGLSLIGLGYLYQRFVARRDWTGSRDIGLEQPDSPKPIAR